MRLLKILPALVVGLFLAVGVTSLPAGDAEAGGWKAKHRSGKGHHRAKHHRRSHHHYGGYRYGGYGYGYRHYGYRHYGYGDYIYGPYWDHRRHRTYVARETRVERGFRYLVKGDPKRAVTVFSKLAEADPSDALPKLGYAIAMSELDELDLGVWAMRRAIRTDVKALHNAPLDLALRPRVRALLDLYHPDHEADPDLAHGDDAHFMVAAILWVLGDDGGASSATEWAISGGDDHESTRALSDAIGDYAAAALEADTES